MIIDIALGLVAVALLWFGSDWIVDAASAIARTLGISELVIGLTVVAFGTSAPEFLVTLSAAIRGLSDISLANVVGSNLMNIGIVLGTTALVRPVLLQDRAVLTRDVPVVTLVSAGVLAVALTGVVGRMAGAVLFGFLIAYTWWLIQGCRRAACAVPTPAAEVELEAEHTTEEHTATLRDYAQLVGGFVAIAVGGALLVESATTIAQAMGVSQWLIGTTLVAGGTSLPELATCLAASIKGRAAMLIGNLVGSNLFNIAGVLGLTALIAPVQASDVAVQGLAASIGLTLVLGAMLVWRGGVGRVAGAFLLLANVTYLIFAR